VRVVVTVVAACLAVLVGLVMPASAATYTVDAGGGGDFLAIKPAVEAAVDGDIIYVNGGTYDGEDNRDILIDQKNLQIIGQNGVPTIDCQGLGRAFNLFGVQINGNTLIRGFEIINGVARLTSGDGGGGIKCVYASPVIEYCTIRDCDASYGGGVQLYFSDAVVRYCWIRDNTANTGGGLSLQFGSPELDMVHVWGNVAAVNGGAMLCFGGTPTINRLNAILNSDAGEAAIQLDEPGIVPQITRCIIAFNPSGAAIAGGTTGIIEHCITYGNPGGNELPGYAGDNLICDPLFCDVYAYDPSVCEDSQALHTVNSWGEYIGYVDVGCYAPCQSPVEEASWGRIKGLYR
jgi:hypothetical protein